MIKEIKFNSETRAFTVSGAPHKMEERYIKYRSQGLSKEDAIKKMRKLHGTKAAIWGGASLIPTASSLANKMRTGRGPIILPAPIHAGIAINQLMRRKKLGTKARQDALENAYQAAKKNMG